MAIAILSGLNGGDKRIRTADPLLAKQVLSQLSYTPIKLVGLSGLEPPTLRLSVVRSSQLSYKPASGGDSRDRTGDLLLARQALSQLSYIPMLSRFSVPRDCTL